MFPVTLDDLFVREQFRDLRQDFQVLLRDVVGDQEEEQQLHGLAVGILHQIFDAGNNDGGLVDSILDGVDAGDMTQLATVVLTVLVAAWLWWRRPGSFGKRQTPPAVAAPEAR